MFHRQPQIGQTKRKMPNKLIAGFAALSTTAIIATSGIAAAQTATKPQSGSGYGGNTNNVGISINVHNNSPNNKNIFDIVVSIFN